MAGWRERRNLAGEIDGILASKTQDLVFERKDPSNVERERLHSSRNIQNHVILVAFLILLSNHGIVSLRPATKTDLPAWESLGSRLALGGVRIVRQIAVESALARRRRGYLAARRDEDGKADIRSNPDNVDRSSSPWPCA
jgi:hypothetical protein